MDDDVASELKKLVDGELANVAGNAHLALGEEVFASFRKRGWIDHKTEVLVGT